MCRIAWIAGKRSHDPRQLHNKNTCGAIFADLGEPPYPLFLATVVPQLGWGGVAAHGLKVAVCVGRETFFYLLAEDQAQAVLSQGVYHTSPCCLFSFMDVRGYLLHIHGFRRPLGRIREELALQARLSFPRKGIGCSGFSTQHLRLPR